MGSGAFGLVWPITKLYVPKLLIYPRSKKDLILSDSNRAFFFMSIRDIWKYFDRVESNELLSLFYQRKCEMLCLRKKEGGDLCLGVTISDPNHFGNAKSIFHRSS